MEQIIMILEAVIQVAKWFTIPVLIGIGIACSKK